MCCWTWGFLEPFADEALGVLDWLQHQHGAGFVAWHSLANIHFMLAPHHDDARARQFVGCVLHALDVAPVSGLAARRALSLPVRDFEDALQIASAEAVGAAVIVTRNRADYRRSPVPAVSPGEFLRRVRH